MRLRIFDKELQYDPDLEAFCAVNSVQQLLMYYGVDNTYKYIDSSLELSLNKTGNPSEINVKKTFWFPEYKNKIKINVPNDKNEWIIFEENKKKLGEGVPIIVGIDMFYLDYTYYYNTNHSNHTAILCGYKNDEKSVTLVDWFKWNFKGDILIENFLKARASVCPKDESPFSGYPVNNVWMEVEDFGWYGDSKELLKRTITSTIENYYCDKNNGEILEIHGVETFKYLYKRFLESKNIEIGSILNELMEFRLICLRYCSNLKLFRYYIKKASEEFKIYELLELIDELNKTINLWEFLFNIMTKSIYKINEDSLKNIMINFGNIISLEEKRYNLLTKLNNVL